MKLAFSILVFGTMLVSSANTMAEEGSHSSTRFLVFVRDESTRALIQNATVSVTQDNGDGTSTTMAGEASVVAALLGKGMYDITASAGGYDSLVYKSIHIPEGDDGELWIPGLASIESHNGPTVIVGAKLRRHVGIGPTKRIVTLVSDSEYYWQTDTPPLPVGGTKAIMNKIDISRVGSDSAWSGGMRVEVFIDANGTPTDCREIDDTHGSRHLIPGELAKLREIIRPAIMSTRFSPARILGMTVRSHIFVPFEISWKGRKR